MTTTDLPNPRLRDGAARGHDASALEKALRARVDGEVRFDGGSRGAYSTDASNYRQVPIGVVVPRTVEAAAEAVAVCREHGAPVVCRGGGTSLGGQTTNTAVVLDFSKYCHRLLSVDPERRTCTVEPGIVLDRLNAELAEHGLEYGPRPATHSQCTVGGMIGNNSCGATAQRAGKVVDNLVRLEVLLYDGTRMWVGATDDEEYERIQRAGGRPAEVYRGLRDLRDRHLADIRTGFPDIPRRVSGYNLDSLLPEQGFNVARALVGSENTLVTVLRAELQLVPLVPRHALALLAYPDIATAADAVPAILEHRPTALEGIDRQLASFEREKNLNPVGIRHFPPGRAFLIVQCGGEDVDAAREALHGLLDGIGRHEDDDDVKVFDSDARQREVWSVRESGLGGTARVPGLPDTWPGWEDSAVAPADLGDYLRDLDALMQEYGYESASMYGHFGQGCVHTRIPFDLVTAEGVRDFRAFVARATDLVVGYGGSLSGEHGDGQARGELLDRMFGSDLVGAFRELKTVFDPDGRMNPGKVVDAYRFDEFLRLGVDYRHLAPSTHFAYPHDDGSFSHAVNRCVGVGNCRQHEGGVMCPSYMVTREEEHSTRGRARLLFEMLDGTARGGAIGDGWRSEAVRDSLDLCLACKGCRSDCPVDVDMATYKAEFLAHHYEGRLRPRTHYSLGWIPVWAWMASFAPGAVNALTRSRGVAHVARAVAGVDQRREVPLFARQTLQQWYAQRGPRGTGDRGEVVLWPDTFTNRMYPDVGRAAVEVLEDAGWRVVVPEEPVCCGLTWISTGQLGTAKRVLQRTVDVLRPYIREGVPVVGLEPSCTAVFRSDAEELFPHDEDVLRLKAQTHTLAELLVERSDGWEAPRVALDALVQTHCHQHAVLGFEADKELLSRMGVEHTEMDSGCCGLAGNFGFEQGHYDVSVACAERVMLPEVRQAAATTAVLADGFSCRTQLEQTDSGGRRGVHLAEVLRAAMSGPPPGDAPPEQAWSDRPGPPGRAATTVAGAASGAVALLGAAGGAALALRAARRVRGSFGRTATG